MYLRSYRTPIGAAIPTLLLAALVTSCGGTDSPTSPSQSHIPYAQTDLRLGTGTEATAGTRVSVNYTGWLYSESATDNKGQQFDSSSGRGSYSFVLGAGTVIQGWDRGVAGMRTGGLRRLVIPPDLAYGGTGNGPIPPNAALVFEVELLSVQ